MCMYLFCESFWFGCHSPGLFPCHVFMSPKESSDKWLIGAAKRGRLVQWLSPVTGEKTNALEVT